MHLLPLLAFLLLSLVFSPLLGAFVLDDVSASVNTVLREDPSLGIARQ